MKSGEGIVLGSINLGLNDIYVQYIQIFMLLFSQRKM